MTQVMQTYWPILAVVVVIAIILAIWLIGRATRPAARERRPDVLDEGAAPAQRNQALIDAPPAAAVTPAPIVPPPAAGTFAGIGEAVAHGAQEQSQAHGGEETRLAQPEPEPEAAPQPTPPAAEGESDDLRRIKGIGPKLASTLHALGITRYAQIAGWTDADLDAIDAQLGAFAGRPRRDSWVEQAQLLASGETGAYEARFGKL